jgi:hypothetical protein
MAHQTSKTLEKQSTPHSIGRLMDANLFVFMFSLFFAISISPGRWRGSSFTGPTSSCEPLLSLHLPAAVLCDQVVCPQQWTPHRQGGRAK